MPRTESVAATGRPNIDGLLSGTKWAGASVTYSLPTLASYYEYGGERDDGFKSLSLSQANAVHKIIAAVAMTTGLSFSQKSETGDQHADLRFASTSLTPTAWAYQPATEAEGGDVWINGSSSWFAAPVAGSYGYLSLMHETGHAIGLSHGHEPGELGSVPAARNSMEFSIMTYASYIGAPTTRGFLNAHGSYAQSLMMDDIAALQALYGADYSSRAGGTVYRWNPLTGEQYVNGAGQGRPVENKVFLTVWDGGGNDTYDFSNYSSGVRVNLNPGAWSTISISQLAELSGDGAHLARGNIANALLHDNDPRSLIENAIGGSGHDMLAGNAGNNMLSGGAGDDTLIGGNGRDVLVGGRGADLLYGGTGTDTAHYGGGAGVSVDLVTGGTAGDALGDRFGGIENVSGTLFNDTIRGTAAANAFTGGAGNDIVDGRDGNDILRGGAGADTLIGGGGYDTIDFSAAATSVSLDLGLGGLAGEALGDRYYGVENITGSAFSDRLTGNLLGNTIYGGSGCDVLSGMGGNDFLEGGAGADRLLGGAGADTFIFRAPSHGGDVIGDFVGGVDVLAISRAAFNIDAPLGPLPAAHFANSTSAPYGMPVFRFDSAGHILSFDPDGAGGKSPIVLAILSGVSAYSLAEIVLV